MGVVEPREVALVAEGLVTLDAPEGRDVKYDPLSSVLALEDEGYSVAPAM